MSGAFPSFLPSSPVGVSPPWDQVWFQTIGIPLLYHCRYIFKPKMHDSPSTLWDWGWGALLRIAQYKNLWLPNLQEGSGRPEKYIFALIEAPLVASLMVTINWLRQGSQQDKTQNFHRYPYCSGVKTVKNLLKQCPMGEIWLPLFPLFSSYLSLFRKTSAIFVLVMRLNITGLQSMSMTHICYLKVLQWKGHLKVFNCRTRRGQIKGES